MDQQGAGLSSPKSPPAKTRSTKMERLRTTTFLLFLVLIVKGGLCQSDWECASPCKCRWKDGKKTAECSNQTLTEIPSSLSAEIQNLDLAYNRLGRLEQNAFKRVRLENLQKLILKHCEIHSVHTDAFNGLKIVIEIDLSGNYIKSLAPGTFDDTERLRVLQLNHNRLEILPDRLFYNLTYLQKVSLSNNHLRLINNQTFYKLPGLQHLSLIGNNFTRLSRQSFDGLEKLGSLELHNNPWNCDCNLQQFRDWAIHRKFYTKPTTCASPPFMAGKLWNEVSSDEFACRPSVEMIGPGARIEMFNGDVTLWCKAEGTPQPQISWFFRSKVINNSSRRNNGDKRYVLSQSSQWTNLTIPDVVPSDKGEYVCVAKSYGGAVEKNVTLAVLSNSGGTNERVISIPLAVGLGAVAVLFLLVALTLCYFYCRRRRMSHDEKSAEAASLDHHGLGEQEKSLITAINPVVKPPRRYDAPSVTSHGTEMTELNRTLLDNDSVFADGVGSVIGVLANGLNEEERERATPEHELNGTLIRGASYRQYPPDLLAFSGGRGSSPTSQASTAPDSSRLPNQHPVPFGSPSSPYVAAFKTLPHPARSSSATPYSTPLPILPRHGYVTIPRRPRAPSWSAGAPTSPTEVQEPVYDNLGARTTADGSSGASLNKSPEPAHSMRGRPLPSTPTTSATSSHYNGIHRVALSSPRDRSAPEGAAERPVKLLDEKDNHPLPAAQIPRNSLGKKIPPRVPPKPKKKTTPNGPLYEDEGEDGTEV